MLTWPNSESYKAHKIIFARTEFATLLQNILHSIFLNTQRFSQRQCSCNFFCLIVGVGGFVGMAVGIPNQFHLGPFCQTVFHELLLNRGWTSLGRCCGTGMNRNQNHGITIFCIPFFQMLCCISLDQTSFNWCGFAKLFLMSRPTAFLDWGLLFNLI